MGAAAGPGWAAAVARNRLLGLWTPAHPLTLLPAVRFSHAQGIDLFDGAYVVDVTTGGYALTFPVTPEEEAERQQQQRQQQQQKQQQGAAAGGPPQQQAVTAVALAGAVLGGSGRQPPADECGTDDSKLNLWALAYRADKRPLLPGCACFTCGSHTRAYVHHLLQAHEMTAQVGGVMGGAGTAARV